MRNLLTGLVINLVQIALIVLVIHLIDALMDRLIVGHLRYLNRRPEVEFLTIPFELR